MQWYVYGAFGDHSQVFMACKAVTIIYSLYEMKKQTTLFFINFRIVIV